LDTIRFSRAQRGTQPAYFEGVSGRCWRMQEDRKHLPGAGLEVVPRDGIEPPTRGFSVPPGPISATVQNAVLCRETRTHQGFQPFLIFVHHVHGVLDIPHNYPRCTHNYCEPPGQVSDMKNTKRKGARV